MFYELWWEKILVVLIDGELYVYWCLLLDWFWYVFEEVIWVDELIL